jgi:iron complex transport system substrate-binding protein
VLLGCSRDAPATGGGQRIITLTPSGTEIVAALGAADRLVGVDDYSTYPPEVAELPKVGSFLNPSPEAILRLRPDVVIAAAAQPEAVRGLRRSGLTVVVLDIHDLGDVMDGLETVGAALGLEERAAQERARLTTAIETVRERTTEPGERRSALVVIDRERDRLGGMIAAGPGSYLDELLGIVGVDNALARSKASYPKISPEQILRAQPALIFDTVAGSDQAARAAWSRLGSVPAVSAGRVYALTEPIFQAPSPRAGEALARLAALVDGAPAR